MGHTTRRVIALVATSAGITGCSSLTHVAAPDLVQPGAFDNAAGALTRRAGAIGDFATAFSSQVFFSGLLADEFTDRSGGFFPSDTRVITPANEVGGFSYPYNLLSTARMDALRAIPTLEQYNSTPAWRVGELFVLLGDVDVLFAENMCSGVPLGVLRSGVPADGPVLTRAQLVSDALTQFDSAAAYAAANDSILNLVRVSQARALLDSGDVAGAAAAVAAVPATYAYQAQYSAAASQLNDVYSILVSSLYASVSDVEGINGLNFVSANDPRVPTQNIGLGQDGAPVVMFTTFSSLSSPIVLASGVEAQLIRAEAALRTGNIAGWAAMLNNLRQTAITPAMDTLPSDSTTAAPADLQVNTLFRERAFWLFATGHRHGDLRRLVRQYGRGVESVFPTGLYQGGPGRYGTDVTFVPFREQTNTNFHGCIDRSA